MNNEVEYESIIASLNLAKELGAKKIIVHNDSQIVVNQMQETYQAWDSRMTAYLAMVKHLQANFQEFTINQVPHGENNYVDKLANLGLAIQTIESMTIPIVYFQELAVLKEA